VEIYDNTLPNGWHFHVSLDSKTCYIMVRDIYDEYFIMRYFTNVEDAINFIYSL